MDAAAVWMVVLVLFAVLQLTACAKACQNVSKASVPDWTALVRIDDNLTQLSLAKINPSISLAVGLSCQKHQHFGNLFGCRICRAVDGLEMGWGREELKGASVIPPSEEVRICRHAPHVFFFS